MVKVLTHLCLPARVGAEIAALSRRLIWEKHDQGCVAEPRGVLAASAQLGVPGRGQ